MGALSLRQFAGEQFLREVVIFHADNLSGPPKLWLHQDGVAAEIRSLSYNFGVGDVFLPIDVENLPQAGCMEMV